MIKRKPMTKLQIPKLGIQSSRLFRKYTVNTSGYALIEGKGNLTSFMKEHMAEIQILPQAEFVHHQTQLSLKLCCCLLHLFVCFLFFTDMMFKSSSFSSLACFLILIWFDSPVSIRLQQSLESPGLFVKAQNVKPQCLWLVFPAKITGIYVFKVKQI